ncbi:MAG: hypothetical protein ABI193_16550 [Minicystis sp.]
MSDLSDAIHGLEHAGYQIDQEMYEETPEFYLAANATVRGKELTVSEFDVAVSIHAQEVGYYVQIHWPGQAFTRRVLSTVPEATEWLIAMGRRLGLIPATARLNDGRSGPESLGAVAQLLRLAGVRMKEVRRGGWHIVSHICYPTGTMQPSRDKFIVVAEPGGGYYVASPWPSVIEDEAVCESPDEVLSWILANTTHTASDP